MHVKIHKRIAWETLESPEFLVPHSMGASSEDQQCRHSKIHSHPLVVLSVHLKRTM